MNFLETNNFIVKHASEKHLLQDLELLKAKQPNHSLVQNSSSRLNFNKKGFDEEILLTLLEVCGPDEILENRKKDIIISKEEQDKANKQPTKEPSALEKIKNQIIANPTIQSILANNSKKKSEDQKRQKKEEFPKINWNNNLHPDIQLCILLYDERVSTYHRMQEIDAFIDNEPSFAKELVLLRIRNQNAHKELQTYNDTQKFAYVHELTQKATIKSSLLQELKELQQNNPDQFLTEITNTQQNIRRISSNINNKKYKSEKEKQGWQENLKQAELKLEILKGLATGSQ